MSHPGEAVLKEIYSELKRLSSMSGPNFSLQPLTSHKAANLLDHVARLTAQLAAYKTSSEVNQKSAEKLKKVMVGLERMATSKFPESGAKEDLLQSQAVKLWRDVNE